MVFALCVFVSCPEDGFILKLQSARHLDLFDLSIDSMEHNVLIMFFDELKKYAYRKINRRSCFDNIIIDHMTCTKWRQN